MLSAFWLDYNYQNAWITNIKLVFHIDYVKFTGKMAEKLTSSCAGKSLESQISDNKFDLESRICLSLLLSDYFANLITRCKSV